MKKFLIFIMFVGIIGLGLNAVFGGTTFTFIQPYTVPNVPLQFYKFDVWGYIDNVKTSIRNTSELQLTTPTRTWSTGEWDALTNNLALILDWILFAINVLIYPFRIGGYTVIQVLAVIGINTTTPNSAGGAQWLLTLAEFLRALQIPYI